MIDSVNGREMSAGLATPASSSPAMQQDDFLKLLVTQLSNQDPLNPQDGSEFVAQLAQFSSVEQLMNINSGMETLAMAQQASTSAQTVGFIGKDILALGDSVHVEGGAAEMSFTLAQRASSAEVNVLDENGKKVATFELDADQLTAGDHTVTYPRPGMGDTALEDGNYRFSVKAKDSEGAPIDSTTWASGRVIGVTFEAGYPQLLLDGDRTLSLSDVVRVRESEEPLILDQQPISSSAAADLAEAASAKGVDPTKKDAESVLGDESALDDGLRGFIERRGKDWKPTAAATDGGSAGRTPF